MKETYFEARKVVDTIKEGEYETNKTHVIELVNDNILKYFHDVTEDNDDAEGLYWDGFCFNWEELYSIDVDRVLKFMEGRLKEIKEEGSDYEKGFIKDIKEKYIWLKKYQGYSFIIKERDAKEEKQE